MFLVGKAKESAVDLMNLTATLDGQANNVVNLASHVGRNLLHLKEKIRQAREQANNVRTMFTLY